MAALVYLQPTIRAPAQHGNNTKNTHALFQEKISRSLCSVQLYLAWHHRHYQRYYARSRRDKNDPSLYYVSGAAGLPWAAALGVYSAESIVNKRNDLDDVFSPDRHFTLGPTVQKILGTKLTFALSNFMRTRSL